MPPAARGTTPRRPLRRDRAVRSLRRSRGSPRRTARGDRGRRASSRAGRRCAPGGLEDSADRGVVRSVEDDLVEAVLRLEHEARLLAGGDAPLESGKRVAQRPKMDIGRVLRAFLRGRALEQRAHLIDLRGLLGRGNCDDRALLRDRRHEPLGGELADDLSDGRSRDADLLDQLPFDEPLPGSQTELDDLAPEEIENLLTKRRGDALDLRRQVVPGRRLAGCDGAARVDRSRRGCTRFPPS